MPNRHKLIDADKLPPGKAQPFEVQGLKIAVYNVDGTFHATDDECPHAGASLASGFVKDGKIGCPWHGADFDLATGKALCPPARGDIKVYKVVVEDGKVCVEI